MIPPPEIVALVDAIGEAVHGNDIGLVVPSCFQVIINCYSSMQTEEQVEQLRASLVRFVCLIDATGGAPPDPEGVATRGFDLPPDTHLH